MPARQAAAPPPAPGETVAGAWPIADARHWRGITLTALGQGIVFAIFETLVFAPGMAVERESAVIRSTPAPTFARSPGLSHL
jgi:hypothetical protein